MFKAVAGLKESFTTSKLKFKKLQNHGDCIYPTRMSYEGK